MPKKLSNTTKSIAMFFTFEAWQYWVLPVISPLATALLGILYSFNWFYIWLGSIFSLACSMHFMLRFDEFRFRITTKDKLIFAQVEARKILLPAGSISSISLGCKLKNSAEYPIHFSIDDIKTSLSDRIPQKTWQKKRRYRSSCRWRRMVS